MSRFANSGVDVSRFAMLIQLPKGFEPSFAGPFGARGFAIGSEDGRVLIATDDGIIRDVLAKASPSSSTINGMAAFDSWVAISTPEEISFMQIGGPALALPIGAHGITVTPSGVFVAPIGIGGIIFAPTPIGVHDSVTSLSDDAKEFYVYRVTCLGVADGAEVLAIAGRRFGVGFIPFQLGQSSYTLSTARMRDFEVVDCCPLFPGTNSMATVALGKDRRLLVFQDILTDKKPVTFTFELLTGIGCRVLSSRGDVYVATSNGFFMFAGFADECLNRMAGDAVDVRVMVMNIEVVDANLCNDKWILVVTPEGVQRFDVSALHEGGIREVSRADFKELRSIKVAADLEWDEIGQSKLAIAM